MISKPVLVTGASGFVGAAVAARLVQLGCPNTRAAVRRAYTQLPLGVEGCVVPTLATDTDWTSALAGIARTLGGLRRRTVSRSGRLVWFVRRFGVRADDHGPETPDLWEKRVLRHPIR